MNIAEILNHYILTEVLEEVDIIYNDVFPKDDGNCIISRHDPSTARETEFIDGSVIGSQQISYYVRSEDAAYCRNILNSIIDRIENVSCKAEDGTEIRFAGVTLPTFVSVDDKNQTVYTATIKADYERPGE